MISMSDGRLAPAHPEAVVSGDTYRFTILTPRLIRMEWHESGQFVDERSQLVASRDFDVPEFTVTRNDDGGLEIVTEYLRLRYDGKEFSEAGLSVQLVRGATDAHYSIWRYGFVVPQIDGHRGNLHGTARTLDLVDGATELERGVLSISGFSVLEDSSTALLSEDGWISARPESVNHASSDLYFFGYGHDYQAAMRDYHRLSGPNPVIPRYTLGNWWSRYWAYSEEEYLALMDKFEEEKVPLSVAVIDMDWHLVEIDPEIGTGWTGYTWNPELFPDPERFLADLHRRGLATTLNLHPADGVRRHEKAYPDVAKALGMDPAEELPIEFDVTSREFVDAYLKYLHHPLEEEGVDFWWIDWQSGGATKIAGLDPLWMLNHIHYVDSGRDGKRPLTFSRYAGLGSHRYPVGFSGDTVVTWDSLDFQPYFTSTAANVGYTWWSHDIGGHMFGSKDVELTVRWFEFGVFSPINRLHSTTSAFMSKEPWLQGPRAHQVMNRYLRFRHRLVPMMYTAAWDAHTDAVAVFRPLYHEWPEEHAAYEMKNEYLLGEHLLVAPITSPEDTVAKIASTEAWLPADGWFDIFTGQHYAGGGRVQLHRDLDQLPVFARAGSVVPLADALEPIIDAPAKLTLRVYPGNGISHLIEDHGEGAPTIADRNVTVFTQELSVNEDGRADVSLTISATSGPNPLVEREIVVEIVGASEVEGVGGAWVAGDVAIVDDELLSPALRIPLGVVDMSRDTVVTLTGLTAVEPDVQAEAFKILDAAEIGFVPKEKAWAAVRSLEGLALAQELAALELPVMIRDAILERSAAARAW